MKDNSKLAKKESLQKENLNKQLKSSSPPSVTSS
jgi:DNA-binding phage protein